MFNLRQAHLFLLLALVFALSGYSLFLMLLEATTSQDAVRPYYADIFHNTRFFGLNTTISTFLLWTTGTCFLIAYSFSNASTPVLDRLFFISQVVIFAFLGFDERFQAHEWVAEHLNTSDLIFFLLIGIYEAGCLWLLGKRFLFNLRCFAALFFAGAFFAIMVVNDLLMPENMPLRLSLEDLAKVWSGFCFVIFGWSALKLQCEAFFESRQEETSR